MDRVSTTVPIGYFGAGTSTLLNRIVAGRPTAVVTGFAEVSPDNDPVVDTDGKLVERGNASAPWGAGACSAFVVT